MDFTELKQIISDKVTMVGLLQESGIQLRTPSQEEQISCPFHGPDRSPSARHYPETNSIYCFTCKKSWDPVSFVMSKRGIRFKEAVNHLAKKAGISTAGVWGSVGVGQAKLGPRKKTGLSARDKILMIRSEVAESLLACRDLVEPQKYANMLYLAAHLNAIEEESEFVKLAVPLLSAAKKSLTTHSRGSENG
jgi:hypothetical protein